MYAPDSGETRLWRHEGRFDMVARMGEEVVVWVHGQGLKRYRDGAWQTLPGGGPLAESAYALLPAPRGGLVVLADDGPIRLWRDGSWSDHGMPAQLDDSSFVSAALVLADGTLVLGAQDGALYFVDLGCSDENCGPDKRRVQRVQVADDRITGLAAGHDGGLFAATDQALFRVAWHSSWSILGRNSGLTGGVSDALTWQQRWYVLTGAGVFAAKPGQHGPMVSFQRFDWTDQEAWDLLPLNPDQAVLAEAYALKLVDHGRVSALSNKRLYPRVLLRSRFDPQVVFVGTEPGFAVLKRVHGAWQLLLVHDQMGSPIVNRVIEAAPGVLWLGSQRDGVWRVQFSDDFTRLDGLTRMGPKQGISYAELKVASLGQLGGSLMASTGTGLFRWNGTRFVRDDLEGLGALLDQGEVVVLQQAPWGDYWAIGSKHAFHRPADGAWKEAAINGFRRGALEGVRFAKHGVVLLLTTSGLLRYQPGPVRTSAHPPQVIARAMQHVDLKTGERRRLPIQPEQVPRFVEGDFGIQFQFALPAFRRPQAVRYQARLLAEILSGCLRRAEDLVARYGGEEFLVVMPGTDLDGVAALAENMRAQVEARGIGATVSIGAATARPPAMTTEALVKTADERLYAAKAKGRNRVVRCFADTRQSS